MKVHVIATDTKAAEDVELDFEFPDVTGRDQAHDNAVVITECGQYGLEVHGWTLADEPIDIPTARIPWEDGAITVLDSKSAGFTSAAWPAGEETSHAEAKGPHAVHIRDHLKALRTAIEARARQAADKARPLAWRLLFPTQPDHAQHESEERHA